MSRRQALILFILLAIFAGALYIRLLVTFTYEIPLGRDGPYNMYNVGYLLEHWPSVKVADPPLFFHFGALTHVTLSAFGSSLMSSFHVATSLASALVALTTFLMMRRLTKNTLTALAAAFFSAFIPASFRMYGELQKNAFGVALAPLFVLFLWRGLEGGRKLDLILAGVALGAVGLTHELVFGTLVIAYLSYLAFLLAHRRRIPWRELKATVIIAILAALICGTFYYAKLEAIVRMSGERPAAAVFMAQGQQPENQPQPFQPQEQTMYRFYDEYIGQPLFLLAAFGTGVAVYRRRPTDFFLLAWAMSALILAQPWVVTDYQWRFSLMLATPVVLLAAVGLIEGIGGLLWRAGENIKAFFGRGPSGGIRRAVTIAGRVAILCLLLLVVVQQARASYDYAWTGQELQPRITVEEYNALQEFHGQVGDAYVFGSEQYLYWVDLVGFKGKIENSEVWELAHMLRIGETQSSRALQLASQWYIKQQDVGENIYAVVNPGEAALLENGELFVRVFDRPRTRAYKLSENFHPPPPSQQPHAAFSLAASQQPLPPKPQEEGSPVLSVLLAPVYVLPGAAKFLVGVPLTVLLWVFLLCAGWELVRRVTKSSEKLRKVFVACLVVILVLVVVLVVRGYVPPMQPGPGMPSGPYP